ncbi:alpha/beta hydrolase family protein [Virgisporangium ochraceum]|uniref:Peptidase S9 prolyl oligopeptidase catalytic domain-containing protein n=1 Tax=Virgisporangium ochraceum TaxID=65505 RepID=A0A8J4A701_9ACTN|nr:alpha/beta fold hydrolase [Virgisporangium ochraceum]GIJ75338.1 hypothetical protein Voc01_102550 [Virgisporangium ochraceum]
MRPAGPGPHPVLLFVHGGPHTQLGWEVFDEAQVYTGAGYAVVFGNPRGSSGYGRAHGRAGAHDFAIGSAAPDLLALLDAALADGDLDGDRVGVMGGSYGGTMTAWLAAHHSEQDLVCPLEQAQRLFFTLKRAGTPVELVIFPGEGHELSRSGLPSHRLARFDVVLEWWDRHLRSGRPQVDTTGQSPHRPPHSVRI